MANIKKNIRFYQPNDPYYWEVDNLPLTELLSNDIVLENRLSALEDTLAGLGDPGQSPSGTFSTQALTDLKAYTEPLSGTAANFGKVFVRPGKFLSRIQMPATRESGWRMMRDKDAYFNNESASQPGTNMLNTTTLTGEFVRETHGLARTAIVEFYANSDNSSKFANIASFEAADFNRADSPSERLDLIYIKGTKALDTDGDTPYTSTEYKQDQIPAASIGVIKGAYFRTDTAGGVRLNGPRFTDATSRLDGRITGMSRADIPRNTTLPGFGSVPMPEDLINFAWHRNYEESAQHVTNTTLAQRQVEKECAFAIPVAYVRVPSNYVAGQPIPLANVIDIRPWFRSAELDYSERAAIAASVGPHGENPFVTKWHLKNEWITPMQTQIDTNTAGVASNSGAVQGLTGRVASAELDISALELSVSGLGSAATSTSLNHEGRLAAVEAGQGAGGGSVTSDQHVFLTNPYAVWSGYKVASQLGTGSSEAVWNITNGIPANHRDNIVAVYFKVSAENINQEDTIDPGQRLKFRGGNVASHEVARYWKRVKDGKMWQDEGIQSYLFHPVSEVTIDSATNLELYTVCVQPTSLPNDVGWRLQIVGYIHRVYTQI